MVEMVPLRREMRGRFRCPDKKDTFSLHFFEKSLHN
jgi:hypothetical protein